jgi:hypothetical protein|tara:strand:- start:460 stop:567 length:108 start_codon:yes stop_codon:yes gene_type:complete
LLAVAVVVAVMVLVAAVLAVCKLEQMLLHQIPHIR